MRIGSHSKAAAVGKKRRAVRVEASRADIFGTGAIHGARAAILSGVRNEPLEVFARYAARTMHRADAQRLAAQQAPMHYGPAALAGQLAGGRGQLSTIHSHWGTVIPAGAVHARITMLEQETNP